MTCNCRQVNAPALAIPDAALLVRYGPHWMPQEPLPSEFPDQIDSGWLDRLWPSGAENEKRRCRPRNYAWAELLKRVFSIDVLQCARCGGRMRILCAINPPQAIRKILDCLGLPSRLPPIVPAILAPVDPYTD